MGARRLSVVADESQVLKPQQVRAKRPARKPAKPIPHTQRLAVAVGGIGVGVLALSVVHCTEAITSLTGTHWFLSMLLAVGIDAGMVACELADVLAEDDETRRWARGYVVAAIGLSMLLNAYSFATHAHPSMIWAGIALGVVIPGLVFVLGRVAGLLYRGK